MLRAGGRLIWQMVFMRDAGSRQKQGLGQDHSGVSVERPGLATRRRRRGLHLPEGGVHTTVPGLHLSDGCY